MKKYIKNLVIALKGQFNLAGIIVILLILIYPTFLIIKVIMAIIKGNFDLHLTIHDTLYYLLPPLSILYSGLWTGIYLEKTVNGLKKERNLKLDIINQIYSEDKISFILYIIISFFNIYIFVTVDDNVLRKSYIFTFIIFLLSSFLYRLFNLSLNKSK